MKKSSNAVATGLWFAAASVAMTVSTAFAIWSGNGGHPPLNIADLDIFRRLADGLYSWHRFLCRFRGRIPSECNRLELDRVPTWWPFPALVEINFNTDLKDRPPPQSARSIATSMRSM
jgi:hypothetical protein